MKTTTYEPGDLFIFKTPSGKVGFGVAISDELGMVFYPVQKETKDKNLCISQHFSNLDGLQPLSDQEFRDQIFEFSVDPYEAISWVREAIIASSINPELIER